MGSEVVGGPGDNPKVAGLNANVTKETQEQPGLRARQTGITSMVRGNSTSG
jgi:hypothetical protein